MRREVIEETRGHVEMRVLVDSEETDELNAIERRELGKGFTTGSTMRKVANIDFDELMALYVLKDKDAVDYFDSNGTDRGALRRLLIRFPLWRCSGGSV